MSETRNIYFVRHGQTDANMQRMAQSHESELNEAGKEQALILGTRLQHISLGTIITSELIRARQTGEIINSQRATGAALTTCRFFNERVKPSFTKGLGSDSSEYRSYQEEFFNRSGDESWRPGDGENLMDLVRRTQQGLTYIEQETEGDVLVVSHGYLLRMITAYILTQSLVPDVYVQAIKNLRYDNTGVTHVKLTNGHWQFGTINDSTHLS